MQETKHQDVNQEEILKQWIQESNNIVFFGGAGVSTESGIRIFGVRTVCIIRNMRIRRRLSSAIAFL